MNSVMYGHLNNEINIMLCLSKNYVLRRNKKILYTKFSCFWYWHVLILVGGTPQKKWDKYRIFMHRPEYEKPYFWRPCH